MTDTVARTSPRQPAQRKSATCDHARSYARFRRHVRSGNFEAIIGRCLRRTLRAAAADPSLELEIGALRIALLRLLTSEPRLPHLAVGIAKLTSVAILASRHRGDSRDDLSELRQAITQELNRMEQDDAQS